MYWILHWINSGTCSVSAISGCRDNYLSGEYCTPSCGVGKYGSATFNSRAGMETTACNTCSGSCYECVGDANATNAFRVTQGYYLVLQSTSVSYGTCYAKDKYGTFSYTLYVNPITTPNGASIQNIDGTYTNAFNYL